MGLNQGETKIWELYKEINILKGLETNQGKTDKTVLRVTREIIKIWG